MTAREPDPDAPFEAVLLVPGHAPPVETVTEVDDDRALVEGVGCKNDHFNDPSARYCHLCGIGMVQGTLVTRLGPRPPLGLLLCDDGATYRLDADYVLGRNPERHPFVAAGTARPLRLLDPDGSMSRQHCRISLVGWAVHVVDLASANGTYVTLPGSAPFRAVPGEPIVLRPGTRITVGERWVRYESHREGN
ncbi:FHA domain-containing protein [Longispora sp. NPDC051575]|uniref:FHA domain-containing protein n=1 Tax=Longispora sp. NPDC051575 TaxID=3154943 RepID=UPI00344A24D0